MKYLLYIFLFICFNGYAQFGPQRIISTEADGSRIICAADVDGDNYIDILSANNFGNNLTWYKNLDGVGYFSDQILISDNPGIPAFAFMMIGFMNLKFK